MTGYPPEDLVLRLGFVEDNLDVVRRLASRSGRCTTVVGFVDLVNDSGRRLGRRRPQRNVANAAAILQGGEWKATYRKILLPNYGVFDEERYFIPGDKPDFLWEIAGIATGISICEDIWLPGRSAPGPGRGRRQGALEHQRFSLSPREGDRTRANAGRASSCRRGAGGLS